jgi:DNA repair ATPase RecN
MNRPEYFPKWMGNYPRLSAPWSETEDQELIYGFYHGMTIKELEEKHGRNTNGITSHLSKLIPDFELIQNYKDEFKQLKEDIENFDTESTNRCKELNRRISNLSSQIY